MTKLLTQHIENFHGEIGGQRAMAELALLLYYCLRLFDAEQHSRFFISLLSFHIIKNFFTNLSIAPLLFNDFDLCLLKLKLTFKSIRRDRKGNMNSKNIKSVYNLHGEILGGFFIYVH